jgi:hypothetical protein
MFLNERNKFGLDGEIAHRQAIDGSIRRETLSQEVPVSAFRLASRRRSFRLKAIQL